MIRSQAAEFFKHEYPIALVRELLNDEHGLNQDLWNKMSALGWFSLVFPEQYRGANLTFVEGNIGVPGLPALPYEIHAAHLHSYVRVLGLATDHDGIETVLKWKGQLRGKPKAAWNVLMPGAICDD